MLGECLFAQGNLGMAMENYDAALAISMASGPWLERLGDAPTPIERSISTQRDIDWVGNLRGARPTFFPITWPLALGNPGVILVLPGGESFAQGQIVSVDALEILRCQAIALRRRNQILGPLASESPLTGPLSAFYSRSTAGLAPQIRSAMNICHGLADLAIGDRASAKQALDQSASLPGNLDYWMTPIALLQRAEIALEAGDVRSASQLLGQVTRLSSIYEQHSVTTEAIHLLTGIASKNRDAATADMIRRIGDWARSETRTVGLQTMAADAEFQLDSGNLSESMTRIAQLRNELSRKEIVLPRLEAETFWLTARVAAANGQRSDAIKNLTSAVGIYRGNENVSTASRRMFQLRLLESLASSGQIKLGSAADLFGKLLGPIDATDWMTQPLESLVWQTSDKSVAIDIWLSQVVGRGKDTETIATLAQTQQHALWQRLPLGGRMLSLRLFLCDRTPDFPPALANLRDQVRAALPGPRATAAELENLLVQVDRMPVELDMQQWGPTEEGIWQQMSQVSDVLESHLLAMALSRASIPQIYPFVQPLPELQQSLSGSERIVNFFSAGQFTYLVDIGSQDVSVERLATTLELGRLVSTLLRQIGVNDTAPASRDNFVDQAWKSTSETLRDKLFPAKSWQRLSECDQVTIVPSIGLWICPFELLPAAGRPWVASTRLRYAPTLGLANPPTATPTSANPRTLLVGSNNFFMSDTTKNAEALNVLAGLSSQTAEIRTVASKARWQPALQSRTRFQRAIIATPQLPAAAALIAPLAYDAGPIANTIANWFSSPQVAPAQLVMPGYRSTAIRSGEADGDLFELACMLAANSNDCAVISRWPVRGRSTETLLTAYLEELDFEPSSVAWQRALETLWATPLVPAFEPILGAKPSTTQTIDGSAPLFWASYLHLGDTTPP
jgi:hypothetical protein